MPAESDSPSTEVHRLVLIGAGWISGYHLAALDRLGRTTLVATLGPLIERGIPFLTEKPLAATDAAGPARIAAAIADRGLVAGVGYHLRGLEALAEVRSSLARNPAHLFTARWLGPTPPPAWWRREETGGGQVVEQATHFYDLARWLIGEATVVGAASTQEIPFVPEGVDLVDATAALLRFESGAIGSFANTRRLAAPVIEIELACANLLITIRKVEPLQTTWQVAFDDGRAIRVIPPGRDPYEVQAQAFLDAVEAGDPDRVLSTYADALKTDRLTRAVVVATGRSG